ncbi:MAG: tRNA pseudouridine(38-40) synthase TruA [Firmicutes bacterium]|nr:tRNA pseudouridine(38-40) synthase TruA [Bacillota bacterium]
MKNYKIIIQYDGTRRNGWQKQGNTQNTIQRILENALSEILGETITVNGAGRTDLGVHAKGQTGNFKTKSALPKEEILIKLSDTLPNDIAVTEITEADERFHARLNAKEKRYVYRVWNSPVVNVFERKYSCRIKEPLDVEKMRAAASLLVGTHDFRGYSSLGKRFKKSTVRTITSLDIKVNGNEIDFCFSGDGFLYNMVRIITGTLIEVGEGKRKPESVEIPLESLNRADAGVLMPPHGLCLEEVLY